MSSKTQPSQLNHDAPAFVPRNQPIPPHPPMGQHRDQGEYEPGFDHQYCRVDIYAAVDAWRSYRTDPTNLQTDIGAVNSLSAPDVEPYMRTLEAVTAKAHPPFTLYQPLRFSNGVKEKEAFNTVPNRSQTMSQQTVPAHRYSLRSQTSVGHEGRKAKKAAYDQPLPSIERSDPLPGVPARNFEDLRRRSQRKTTPLRTGSPAAPSATDLYLGQAKQPAVSVETARKLLVILDLNGTLGAKARHHDPNSFKVRPGVCGLLDYLFENHVVMVYTSSQPQNAQIVVRKLLSDEQRSKLAALWGRDRLDLSSAQYREKVQVYKRLDKIWADPSIQATHAGDGKWDQSNTILVDDSHLKALAQPHNLLQVPEFLRITPSRGKNGKIAAKCEKEILQSLIVKLEALKHQADVSRLIRRWQTGEEEIPRVPGAVFTIEERVTAKDLAAEKHAQDLKVIKNDDDGADDLDRADDDSEQDHDSNEEDTGARIPDESSGAEQTPKPAQLPGLHLAEQTTLAERPKKKKS